MPRHRKIKEAGSVYDQEQDPVNMPADDDDESGFIRMLPPAEVFTYPSPPATYRPPSPSDQDRVALIQMLRKKLNELDVMEGNPPVR